MQLLPELRSLEEGNAEEDDAEDPRHDLLFLLLRLEAVDVPFRHYPAPVAEASLEDDSSVVVVSVVLVVAVAAGGVAAGTDAGAAAYTNASITSVAWICGNFA
jgi:hypothetical protein